MMAGCGADGARPEAGTEAVVEAGTLPSNGTKADSGGEAGSGATIAPTCSDTIKDKTETDVDCGGGACLPCIDGQVCKGDSDCLGTNCVNGSCATPQCTNKSLDTGETDVDCGGSTCRRCTTGKACIANTDCVSGACNNKQCACPKGMTVVSLKNENAYCIDEIEVSKYQYDRFLKAGVLFDNQTDACKPPTNVSFAPRRSWPPLEAPPGARGEGMGTPFSAGVGQAFNFALPVHYVDWCDAVAYCTWAGKKLCGSTSGGSVDFSKAASAADDAWYNACSFSGDQAYPYSALDYSASNCNVGQGIGAGSSPNFAGPAALQRSGFGDARNQDEGVLASTNGDLTGSYSIIYGGSCQGGFTGLYNMTGNVAEWEDSCDSSGNCRIRGGSFLNQTDAQGQRCDNLSRTQPRVAADADREQLRDVGIRCCLF